MASPCVFRAHWIKTLLNLRPVCPWPPPCCFRLLQVCWLCRLKRVSELQFGLDSPAFSGTRCSSKRPIRRQSLGVLRLSHQLLPGCQRLLFGSLWLSPRLSVRWTAVAPTSSRSKSVSCIGSRSRCFSLLALSGSMAAAALYASHSVPGLGPLSSVTSGTHLLIWYPGDTVHHERVVLAWEELNSFLIMTPDGDLYPEDLSVPPLSSIHHMPADRSMPFGIMRHSVYCFEDGAMGVAPTAAQLPLLINAVLLERDRHRSRAGLPAL